MVDLTTALMGFALVGLWVLAWREKDGERGG